MAEDKMFKLQGQIRQNQAEVQEYLKDLDNWSSDIKKKESNLKSSKDAIGNKAQKLPPVRNSLDRKKKVKKKKKKENGESQEAYSAIPSNDDTKEVTKQSKKISGFDFRAWDQFDVDKACAEIDEDADRSGSASSSEYETDEDWEVERKKQQAIYEKDKGNQYFKEKKYDLAIECYTQGMQCDMSNALLPANRAMALLKQNKYAAAERDCSIAIQLDPTYVKAYARRATARKGLEKWRDSKSDFEKVLALESSNKEAKAELEKLDKKINPPPLPTEDTTGMVKAIYKPPNMRSKKPLIRLDIEEIGVDNEEQKRTEQIKEVKSSQSEVKHKMVEKDEKLFEQFTENASPASIVNMMSHSKRTPNKPSADEVIGVKASIEEIDGTDVKETVSSKRKSISPRINSNTAQSNTLVKKTSPMTSPRDTQTDLSPRIPPVPQSSFQFQTDCKVLKKHKEKFYTYFKAIPPGQYKKLIGNSLESDMLLNILTTLNDYYVPSGADVFSELDSLANVQRFTMTVMFMSTAEQKVIKQLLSYLTNKGVHNPSDIEELKRLDHITPLFRRRKQATNVPDLQHVSTILCTCMSSLYTLLKRTYATDTTVQNLDDDLLKQFDEWCADQVPKQFDEWCADQQNVPVFKLWFLII
ncbi:unnamed protein product [Owenia fusiformis]|uniref:RNA polymerase II-associated protein 3 n=1 Tax=Owenia fusiformis TaxID=6347 RepID=A0A8S4NTR1_OWEFU|nr:unnamed protein product [Owenia fusiformis]